jgi:hypothetical protein
MEIRRNEMTTEIPREQWKEFFDNLSRELLDWETTVEVISDNNGAQLMSEGLPFAGLTFEDAGHPVIELTVGSSPDTHQTHTIDEPTMVAFEGTGLGPKGVLDIEDERGTKTLVRFIQPFPVLVEYVKTEMVGIA